MTALPLSEPIRLHQIGAGVSRRLEPDAATRQAVARLLDLQALDTFVCDLSLSPTQDGWKLAGRLTASAVQTCGITLEALPVELEHSFSIRIVESAPDDDGEIIIDLEDDDAPDVAEDGRIDLGQYAVEQLSLAFDPFPRKPGAEFVPPQEPTEISPFAVLKTLRPGDQG